MNDIRKHICVNKDRLSEMKEDDLNYLISSSEDVIYSITRGMKSIANLASAAVNSEEYSQDDAMTDLDRLSRLFSVLPLIIEAEYENNVNAVSEIRERQNKAIRRES
ncbi:hypothetical protein KKI90_20500 [Xenorhabdus bovienii]|uniref:hypothetical protein n=1 Tax=Xenorhabdus bovienii TaxID=40576 RepID=UPI00237C891A|nr:hypothetical protein [Xenorhabdus bovienii]MDE1487016.1 hypothetical protein [Xenorhabdus bovienii]MDE9479534.1 hypothetical protein [Xenorhabdus bovienii]MDE9532223.1 hypothetical protein [Xenorhabdus bovienii]